MTEPKNKEKFAVASGPINRRTATAAQRGPVQNAPSPVALARIQAAHTKHRLGASLVARLTSAAAQHPREGKTTGIRVAQALCGTVGAMGVFLGLIQGAWLITLAGTVALTGVAGWVWVGRRLQRQSSLHNPADATAWIDARAIANLDAALERLARESSPETVELLRTLKDTLARCVALLGDEQVQGMAAPDDRLFVGEAIRRYIPDSLNACLKVPKDDRATRNMDAGKTAVDLLHAQVILLGQQLSEREARLVQWTGEALLQQQRFLAAKTQSPM